MCGMSKDYGYFGDGLDGYIHYKQAFDNIFKESGGLSEDEFLSEDSFINDEYPEDDDEMYDWCSKIIYCIINAAYCPIYYPLIML